MEPINFSHKIGRYKFLEAVKKVNPEVLESLRDRVLLKFQEAVKSEGIPRDDIPWIYRELTSPAATAAQCGAGA